MKRIFTLSNLGSLIVFSLLLAMFISPEVKGWTIQSMMKIGLFQPNLSTPKAETQPLSQDVIFRDREGGLTRLKELRGKIVFLNFWATWCPPCRAEMPSINKLYGEFKGNKSVVFIMVDADGDLDRSAAFLTKRQYNFPVYAMASEVPDAYFSGSLPTTVILDKRGRIAFHHVGAADYTNPKISNFIKELIRLDD